MFILTLYFKYASYTITLPDYASIAPHLADIKSKGLDIVNYSVEKV
jgi:hypothetical protein